MDKIFLIFRDSVDDACEIMGYIFGTEEDADRFCDKVNEDAEYSWEEYVWMRLDRLDMPDEEEEL